QAAGTPSRALGIGDLNEVRRAPDSGKIMVRKLKTVGLLETTDYMAGEPQVLAIVGSVQQP
ncbi:MAG: hypothetical protein KC502_18445, partial [Myxococcales bacterium]|nr:hypothetical protein [Myxococcales bacterium]